MDQTWRAVLEEEVWRGLTQAARGRPCAVFADRARRVAWTLYGPHPERHRYRSGSVVRVFIADRRAIEAGQFAPPAGWAEAPGLLARAAAGLPPPARRRLEALLVAQFLRRFFGGMGAGEDEADGDGSDAVAAACRYAAEALTEVERPLGEIARATLAAAGLTARVDGFEEGTPGELFDSWTLFVDAWGTAEATDPDVAPALEDLFLDAAVPVSRYRAAVNRAVAAVAGSGQDPGAAGR